MVIGSGFLAKAFSEFNNEDDIILYASGVSNSAETRISEYLREKKLLTDTIETFPDKKIIYFSTISLFDPSLKDSLYIKHKAEMESYLAQAHKNTLVFRLPNVVGFSDNPNTLTNYLFHQIKNGQSFKAYKTAYRYLMDIEDVVRFCSYIIRKGLSSNMFNISFSEPISVPELIEMFEKIMNKKAFYTVEAKGSYFDVPNDISEIPLSELGIHYTNDYYSDLIKKYYSKLV
jgi:nucleoside-diphosphate-sugar epimerase